MATADLLLRLKTKEGRSESLYEWCALYCVFRDREPRTAQNLPLIKYLGDPFIIRQAYVKKGVAKLAMADVNGSYELADYNEDDFSPPDEDELAEAFGLTAGEAFGLLSLELLGSGTLVLVDDPNEDSDTTGPGGIVHAPTPSYKIVGIIPPEAPPTETAVTVRVYVRGEHFVPDPYNVTVPIMGVDKFYSAQDDDSARLLISNAIRKAYNNLDGLGSVKDAAVKVSANGEIELGTPPTKFSIEALYRDNVTPALSTPQGQAYADAVDTPMLYTYVETKDVGQLNKAIDSLRAAANKGAADTLEAAEKLRDLLFPGAASKPVVTTTPTISTTDEAVVEDLRQEVQEAEAEAARCKADNAQLQLDLTESRDQVAELAQELERAREQTAGEAVTALQAENRDLGADLQQARTHIRELETRLDQCMAEGDANRAAAAQVGGLKREITALTGERDGLDAEVRRLEIALEAALAGKPPPAEPVEPPKKPTRRAESADVRALSEEIDRLAKQIVTLKERIRRNPDDNDAKVQLADKQRVLEAKSSRLFELMR
jgi:hypothetical protein